MLSYAAPEMNDATEAEASSRFRIMLVDDQVVMRKIIRKLLSQFGDFQIIEADNGRHAMDILLGVDDDLPDLIITDLHMDEMDGLTLCNSIRRIKNSRVSAIPVVLLTGERDAMVLDVSRQVGACAILQKPISSAELQKQLSKVVGFEL